MKALKKAKTQGSETKLACWAFMPLVFSPNLSCTSRISLVHLFLFVYIASFTLILLSYVFFYHPLVFFVFSSLFWLSFLLLLFCEGFSKCLFFYNYISLFYVLFTLRTDRHTHTQTVTYTH